jgi:hypothetical protein
MATLELSCSGVGSRATGHMATPEPFPTRWRARCHGARSDTRVVPYGEVGLEPRDTWRHWSPSLLSSGPGDTGHVAKLEPPAPGGRSGVTGHVVTPEPFPIRWRARCHGARGDARSLWHWERVWSQMDMRRHRSSSLPGAVYGVMGLELGLVHGGTRYTWYRQWPPGPLRERQ